MNVYMVNAYHFDTSYGMLLWTCETLNLFMMSDMSGILISTGRYAHFQYSKKHEDEVYIMACAALRCLIWRMCE